MSRRLIRGRSSLGSTGRNWRRAVMARTKFLFILLESSRSHNALWVDVGVAWFELHDDE